MYEPTFSNISACEIANEVKTKGYFSTESALTDEYVNALLHALNFSNFLVNTNDVGVFFFLIISF